MRASKVLMASCVLAVGALVGCGDDDGGGGGGGSGRISFAETCPAFSPCGGDLVGTWSFDGGCVPRDVVVGDLMEGCPDARVTDVSGRVTGTMAITETNIERNGSISYSASVTVPSSCTMGATCAQLTAALAMAGAEGSCREASGGCACTLSGSEQIMDSTTYTVSGSTLTTGEGETYDFCVQGGTLTYREAGDPATLTLVR